MKQSEQILRHLKEVGPITGDIAITEYGIPNIRHKIYILREEGHSILSDEKINCKSKYYLEGKA